MTQFGYTMMCEQSRPDQLVRDVRSAEEAGFDFSVISDHYQPWLEEQGHSGYARSILGAAAQATERIPLMSYVTCPIIRYHPAVVAQKAATVQILSGGRFRLGLGAGENLNEHVVGRDWPSVGTRHEMLSEALDIISGLLESEGSYNYRGKHFDVESAVLWDRPETRVLIGVAVSGKESCRLAGEKADLMIATEPRPELEQMFGAAGARAVPVVRARLEGQRRPARPLVVRGRYAVRDPRAGWPAATLRPGRRGARREDKALPRRRLYGGRARADRRRPAGEVLRVGTRGAAPGVALAMPLGYHLGSADPGSA